jgi:hypothetical protein
VAAIVIKPIADDSFPGFYCPASRNSTGLGGFGRQCLFFGFRMEQRKKIFPPFTQAGMHPVDLYTALIVVNFQRLSQQPHLIRRL